MAVTVGKFKVHFREKLGQGRFGNVYKAYDEEGKTDVAAKEISLYKGGLMGQRLWDLALKEYSIQDHPNIVRLLGQHDKHKKLLIFMELCDLGSLSSFMKGHLPDIREKLKMMYQCADAIHFLHNRKPQIIHRDIKPENVLMKSEGKKYTIKISDFWMGKILEGVDFEKNQGTETIASTMAFMAPEFFEHFEAKTKPDYHRSVDTFSLGLLFQTIFLYNGDDESMLPRTGKWLTSSTTFYIT